MARILTYIRGSVTALAPRVVSAAIVVFAAGIVLALWTASAVERLPGHAYDDRASSTTASEHLLASALAVYDSLVTRRTASADPRTAALRTDDPSQQFAGARTAAIGPRLAAEGGARLLGAGTSFGSKIEGQLAGRGWTKRLVQSTIDRPTRTVATRDTRYLPGGGRMNDPATAYYGPRGGYVVRNNRTGDIVQVSDRADPGWQAPWGP